MAKMKTGAAIKAARAKRVRGREANRDANSFESGEGATPKQRKVSDAQYRTSEQTALDSAKMHDKLSKQAEAKGNINLAHEHGQKADQALDRFAKEMKPDRMEMKQSRYSQEANLRSAHEAEATNKHDFKAMALAMALQPTDAGEGSDEIPANERGPEKRPAPKQESSKKEEPTKMNMPPINIVGTYKGKDPEPKTSQEYYDRGIKKMDAGDRAGGNKDIEMSVKVDTDEPSPRDKARLSEALAKKKAAQRSASK